MPKKMLSFIQMSDLHIHWDENFTLLGVNPRISFENAFQHLIDLALDWDFLLISGDLSHDGSYSAYQYIIKMMERLEKPIFAIPGNHDELQMFTKTLTNSCVRYQNTILLNQWLFILLNSHKENAVSGYLSENQKMMIDDAMKHHPNLHTILFLHHHPILANVKWLDQSSLTNREEFWQWILPYKNIKAVVFGHVHQALQTTYQGIECYGCPSTWVQFKPDSSRFSLEHIPQGFRLFNLFDDGSIQSEVIRLPQYVGYFEEKATGY